TETIILSMETIRKPMQLAMRPNSGFDGFHWNGTVSSKWNGMLRILRSDIAAPPGRVILVDPCSKIIDRLVNYTRRGCQWPCGTAARAATWRIGTTISGALPARERANALTDDPAQP